MTAGLLYNTAFAGSCVAHISAHKSEYPEVKTFDGLYHAYSE